MGLGACVSLAGVVGGVGAVVWGWASGFGEHAVGFTFNTCSWFPSGGWGCGWACACLSSGFSGLGGGCGGLFVNCIVVVSIFIDFCGFV